MVTVAQPRHHSFHSLLRYTGFDLFHRGGLLSVAFTKNTRNNLLEKSREEAKHNLKIYGPVYIFYLRY